jgi:hypothetical protein
MQKDLFTAAWLSFKIWGITVLLTNTFCCLTLALASGGYLAPRQLFVQGGQLILIISLPALLVLTAAAYNSLHKKEPAAVLYNSLLVCGLAIATLIFGAFITWMGWYEIISLLLFMLVLASVSVAVYTQKTYIKQLSRTDSHPVEFIHLEI